MHCMIFALLLVALHLGMPDHLNAQADTLLEIPLTPMVNMEAAGLIQATGSVILDVDDGWAIFRMTLPSDYELPERTVFEGWLVDFGGVQDPNFPAFSADQAYGPAYADRNLAVMSNLIPYWLSTGALVDAGNGTLEVAVRWQDYTFEPFDAFTITIETDGNQTPWDPRPGSPGLFGEMINAVPYTGESVDIEALLGTMPDMSVSQGIRLEAAALAESAGLAGISGRAFVLIEQGAVEVEVELPEGVTLPEGTAMEVFIADGGRGGNFGTPNAHRLDNAFGAVENNEYVSAVADVIPYATGLGNLVQDDNGVYRVQMHFPAYAFRVYDVIMVTLESDGNRGNYNPRAGTPMLVGALAPDTDYAALIAIPRAEDMVNSERN
jgi:hypothetical protein